GGHLRPPLPGRGGKPHRSWQQRLVLGLGISFVTVCLLAASGVFYVLHSYHGIHRYKDLDVDEGGAGDPQNLPIVGSDSRADASAAERAEVGTAARSDTIMVLRIDPETESAEVLSFQRDLMVPIAGTGRVNKINSAYAKSRQTLIDTIKANFGI